MDRKPRKRNNGASVRALLERDRALIDRALDGYLPKDTAGPARDLRRALRYAVFSGGKRVRPVLTLEACRAVGGRSADVLPAACAIELIHSYSLVHDDLPCMDDDDTRRGRPSCHRKFGEGTALLAGDALLTAAFGILGASRSDARPSAAARRLEAVRRISDAAGMHGMVIGQAVDVEYQRKDPDLATLEYINTHKSGALIAVSVWAGAYLGGAPAREVEALSRYGRCLGLLFQIVDDILDGEGYARILGVTQARRQAAELAEKAKDPLRRLTSGGRTLAGIADFVLNRTE